MFSIICLFQALLFLIIGTWWAITIREMKWRKRQFLVIIVARAFNSITVFLLMTKPNWLNFRLLHYVFAYKFRASISTLLEERYVSLTTDRKGEREKILRETDLSKLTKLKLRVCRVFLKNKTEGGAQHLI